VLPPGPSKLLGLFPGPRQTGRCEGQAASFALRSILSPAPKAIIYD
jgi:hypothetical protein